MVNGQRLPARTPNRPGLPHGGLPKKTRKLAPMIVCYNVYLYYCFVYTPLRMGLLWCFRFNGVRATLAVALCFGWKRMAGVWEKTPKYSFVIPVRNRKGLRLRNTLASLEAQRFPRSLYEIIVMDY